MAMSNDEMANLRTNYYHYRNRRPALHSRPRPRQSRPGSSRGPQRSASEPDPRPEQKRGWSMKRILVTSFAIAVSLLLIFVGVTWGVVWKPINDSLQNDPVIGNKFILTVQINQPKNVTKPATIQVSYVDANDNAASVKYPLPGKTFALKGEVLHLLGEPAHFRLLGVTGASTNINAAPSTKNDRNGSDLDSSENGPLLTITPCSVVIGPITDTPLQKLTITVLPDGTAANSCTLSNK